MANFRYIAEDMAGRSHSGSDSGLAHVVNSGLAHVVLDYAIAAVGGSANLKSVTITRVEPLIVIELTESQREAVLGVMRDAGVKVGYQPPDMLLAGEAYDKIKNAKPRSA